MAAMRYFGVIVEVTKHNKVDEPVLFKQMVFINGKESRAEKLAGGQVFTGTSQEAVFKRAKEAGYTFRWTMCELGWYVWKLVDEPKAQEV